MQQVMLSVTCYPPCVLTWQSLWQLVLPKEASCHHKRQNEEEHQTQLGPFHLHPAAFRESFKFYSGRRSNHSRSRLKSRQGGTETHKISERKNGTGYTVLKVSHSFSI